ncbi:MAG: hypothetical protein IKE48_05290 [Parasporobacterium sp.]|nr:hypothetical protein [Parasporobacterium sp.]
MRNTKQTDQLNSVERIFAEGNTVRKVKVYETVRMTRPRRPLQKTERQKQVIRKVDRQKRAIRLSCIGFSVAVLVALCVVMLTMIVKNSDLNTEISTLETEWEELRSQNDSKEYDMNSSVDLNYIVQVATSELGMVRSSAGQIYTYDSSDSEYIKQLAEIPTE